MITKLCLVFAFLISIVPLVAQETVRSTVGVNGSSKQINAEGKTYVVQQSIGQASVIGDHSTSGITLLQGFIQPPIRVEINTFSESSLQATVYPNPFDSNVTVRFSEAIEGTVTVVLYDVSGRIIYNQEKPPSKEIVLDFGFLSTASYLLRVSHEGKEFTANIIKN